MFNTENNEVLKEKFRVVFKKFVSPTAEIYGGVKGLYDYRMNGAAIMDNIIHQWKIFFIVKEKMLNVKCTMLTPEPVLKASGHVDRFNDFIVKDLVTGENHRADHFIKAFLNNMLTDKTLSMDRIKEIEDTIQIIDNLDVKGLGDLIKSYDMKSPDNNELSHPMPFNLMFSTNIGPSGDMKGYLRPETAQGIFTNFKNCLEDKQGKLPFAVAQIGSSFRNEIAPRNGLIRVREFEMAEIEHFLDPLDKSHRKFVDVAHLNIIMFTGENQLSGKSASVVNLGEAVANKLVNNETLGYFIGRIYLFLTMIGIKHEFLRFRQHMNNEMAHYASDCWDAECMTSYGWVECVGCADRGCFDLEKHTECSGVKLVAQRTLATPRVVNRDYCRPNMKVLGSTFKKDGAKVAKHLQELSGDEAKQLLESESVVTIDGVQYPLKVTMGDMMKEERTVHTEEFVPTVIEPSFGLGRIFHSLMEQNFAVRDNDGDRTFFTLPVKVAPYKFSILPLSSTSVFEPLVEKIDGMLADMDFLCLTDSSSASIGKRYARLDMIGIPYGITVDFDSVNLTPASVTVRERDSMLQIRVTVDELAELARKLVNGLMTWADARAAFPAFDGQSDGQSEE